MPSAFNQCVDAIHVALEDSSVAKGIFRVQQSERDALRRIVWIPTDFATTTPKRVHSRDLDGRAARLIVAEQWTVEAHITAANFEELEALRHKLLRVHREVMPADCVPLGGVWTTQDADNAAHMLGGAEKAVQRFSWTFNILHHTDVAPLSSAETTPQLEATLEAPFVTNAP